MSLQVVINIKFGVLITYKAFKDPLGYATSHNTWKGENYFMSY